MDLRDYGALSERWWRRARMEGIPHRSEVAPSKEQGRVRARGNRDGSKGLRVYACLPYTWRMRRTRIDRALAAASRLRRFPTNHQACITDTCRATSLLFSFDPRRRHTPAPAGSAYRQMKVSVNSHPDATPPEQISDRFMRLGTTVEYTARHHRFALFQQKAIRYFTNNIESLEELCIF